MSGWLRRLRKGKGNGNGTDAQSPLTNNGDQVSNPARAHLGRERHMSDTSKLRSFLLPRIDGPALYLMTILVEVWRPGVMNDPVEVVELATVRVLKDGLDRLSHLSTSYSYEKFLSHFTERINRRTPLPPIDMRFGKIHYDHQNGDIKFVEEPQDFEVALQHLFNTRGETDNLKFTFQAESQEARTDRLAKDVGEYSQNILGSYSALNSPSGFSEFSIRSQRGSDSIAPGSPPPPVVPSGRLVSPRPGSSGFLDPGATGRPPTPASPTRSVGGASTQAGFSRPSIFSRRAEKAGDVIAGRPPTSQGRRLSDPIIPDDEVARPATPRSPARPPSSIGSSIKTVINSATGAARRKRETREQERERFKGLFKEEGRVSFKKGGDDEDKADGASNIEECPNDEEDEEVDAPEPIEVDDDDDDEIPQEDRIVAKLQALQYLPELTQLDGPTLNEDGPTITRWEDCCRLFRRDPKDTGLDSLVHIAGLKTPIYQYQAFSVYWQMANSRELGGGFIADDMGLGKTLSFLAYIVVERQLSVLWRDVRKSREARDRRHLMIQDQTDTAECPTPPRRGWIACPCSKLSPSSLMVPQPGLRMACVPHQLVGSWWGQWKAHVDTTNTVLAMKIIVDSPISSDINATTDDRLSSSSNPQIRTRIKAAVYGSKPTEKRGGVGDDHPKEYQEGWLLLTTKETYPKFAKMYQTEGQVHDPKNPGNWMKGTRTALVFGIVMIDESHEEYFKNKGRAEILTKLPTGNCSVRPFLWGYSGTPFSQTPRGLEGVLWAIESHAPQTEVNKTGWATNPRFEEFQWTKLDHICKLFDEQLKSKERDDDAIEAILEAFKPFLTHSMIRRTADTTWFGHSLIKLRPHIHQDIILEQDVKLAGHIPEFEAKFQEERDAVLDGYQFKWDEDPDSRRSDIRPTKLGFNVECRLTWRSRLLATLPWLWKLTTPEREEENRLTLSESEVLDFRGSDQKERATPYAKFLKNIVEGSPKCVWLYNFIQDLSTRSDVNGEEEKLIILTQFPQVAFVLKLFFQRYFPDKKDRVGMVVGRMKAREKNEIINGFTDALDDRGKRKAKANIQFLIGTTRYLGVGLHLTRASNVVLMEPDYDFSRELQGYHRVHRIGQRNPLTRSFRLIDSGSEIEQRILKRQRDRKEFPGRIMSDQEIETFGLGQGWPLKQDGTAGPSGIAEEVENPRA